MKIFLFPLIALALISCASQNTIIQNENQSSQNGAEKILDISDTMISNKEIFIGGCWDYINEVYNRAGFNSIHRLIIYKSKFSGPYYDTDNVLPGDWLYFVNHSYRDIEHSAIFVKWLDKDKKIALMVNYLGEKKKVPATYKEFHLDKVYNVIRPKSDT